MAWTEERVQLLTRYWGTGKSASEIAELLGGVSRNAVIGKAHRLGLASRPSPIKRGEEAEASAPKAASPAAPTASAAPASPAPQAAAPAPEEKAPPEPAVEPVRPAPAAGGATIYNLTERTCRWPLGDPKDPGFHFCGHQTHAGTVYCREHNVLAYQPPRSRRDEGSNARRRAAAG